MKRTGVPVASLPQKVQTEPGRKASCSAGSGLGDWLGPSGRKLVKPE